MFKLPQDKIPTEYNQEVMTRITEDIYSNLGNMETGMEEAVEAIAEQIEAMNSQLSGVKSQMSLNSVMEETVMPPPENLSITKFANLPFVFVKCKHLEIIKYPYVRGFQFFISQKEGFTPTTESGEVVLKGTHDGAAGMNLSDTASLVASTRTGPAGATLYTNIPFFYDMNLVGKRVVNRTDNSTGAVTVWSNATPWQMTTTLAGGTTNQWNTNDAYEITITYSANLVHQGPLPFAVYVLRPNQTWPRNPKWDGVSYYVKARTYGIGGPRSGRFSDFVCASCTAPFDYDVPTPIINTIINKTNEYLNQINWTPQDLNMSDGISHYRVYRTTANQSNLLTTDTYLIADHITGDSYEDKGYDAVLNPNGAEPCVTYYYWVRPVDINGNIGDNTTSTTGHILIAADPVIYAGAEEEDKGWGYTKNWIVYWTCAGDAMGYFVRYRLKLNGVYGVWTEPVYIPHTTEFGLSGGEDIQSYTFQNLLAGHTYTFAVRATWNPLTTGVFSNWVTQDYTIDNTSPPGAPT